MITENFRGVPGGGRGVEKKRKEKVFSKKYKKFRKFLLQFGPKWGI